MLELKYLKLQQFNTKLYSDDVQYETNQQTFDFFLMIGMRLNFLIKTDTEKKYFRQQLISTKHLYNLKLNKIIKN